VEWEREIPRANYQHRPSGLSPHKRALGARSRSRRRWVLGGLVGGEPVQVLEVVIARPDTAAADTIVEIGGSPQVGELGDTEGVSPLHKARLNALDYVPALWKWDGVLRHGLELGHHVLERRQSGKMGILRHFR
jgi:hypothetical protein